ncbi:DGQHR domain-containing protein [Sphingobium yanoikuyae]|uniref:DGQHR domain-containing protein n=1 Tax=Sphingobium yanoikuyae TaxID=13690 RepID=A0AA42X1Z4_SPHYA|nr:DGQHR domain-containing protein [Sphingobium yanoikuyae]MDH2134511.1 DGQHR domain-containing protein [Sphingobium yanoikuyae]MDH2151996.1 DGQHR domain-containing protein [Sphingobium yanoikuyae]MDH2169945.1 DGQHR domain-containing protein [Sphingobium yanoikuyae]
MSLQLKMNVVRARQPLGDLYIGTMASRDLWEIADYDMREIREQKDNIYLATGVQRELSEKRVQEIAAYVQTIDATFPTAVVLAISTECVSLTESADGCLKMSLRSELVPDPAGGLFGYERVARVIDGQHRIEGLRRAGKEDFDVNVAILVDADIEDQARVFATVNLAQTKVSKSLVYDLFSYSTSNSPERVAHSVCLSLDQAEGSPLQSRIKRLGTATPGRFAPEPLSQATVVEGLLSHMVADKKQLIADRDWARRGKAFRDITEVEARKLVLRRFFLSGRDVDLAELMWNYFDAVKRRWPVAWEVGGTGQMLPRTNGFRALIRFFKDAYNELAVPGSVISTGEFSRIFEKSTIQDADFNTENYPPGTSGETRLYRDLLKTVGR